MPLPPLRSAARLWCIAFFALLIPTFLTAQHSCQEAERAVHHAQAKGGGPVALWPMDILHQRITLDLTVPNVISGACAIRFTPREENLDHLLLDLLALTTDSVTTATGTLAFTHVGEVLDIALGTTVGTDDTLDLTVHYHGDPVTDGSGFGGFYTGAYTYNLGVAFQSVPHSYGRAWFPCVDNFTERNSYEFIVKTAGNNTSWCNGELIGETDLGGGMLVRHWRIGETMPAYLASVASSNYVAVRDTFPSLAGHEVPVTLVARPADTTAMKNSFTHLQDAFDHFEAWFGAYSWNRVGYVLTPQGAMEHATSIHYPQSIADGSLDYEDVMAHELAHHWFGDLVTCDRAEEMYINEGFAEYLSFLFLEDVYGPQRYRNTVRSNHRIMVHRAHLLDEGWWALSEVPQEWTYGEHSYNKGADVLHTLRGYLGDELFRQGLTSFLETYAFQPVNTAMLRDHLTDVTGIGLSDFFADWVMQPGWAAFEVDSFRVDPPSGGTYPTEVWVEQKQRGPSSPYHNVPLTVTCVSADGQWWDAPQPMMAGDIHSSFSVAPPFTPTAVVLNADERLSLAMTNDVDTITEPGTLTHTQSDLRFTVNSIPAPVRVLTQEYWVAADAEVDEAFAYHVSPDRYWRVTGAIPEAADITGRITFDGRPIISGYYDVGLMQDAAGVTFHEDSLVLLYRPDASWSWSLHPDFTVNTLGDPTNKMGRIDFNGLRAGEYTLAWRKSAVAVPEVALPASWTLHPNPASDHVMVRTNGDTAKGTVELIDRKGSVVRWIPMQGDVLRFPLEGISKGSYLVRFSSGGASVHVGKVVVAP